MTTKKNNLEIEYDSIKAKLICVENIEKLYIILEKIKLIEIELKTKLSKGKAEPKTIW